jgi:hypothetical protein
MGRTQTGSRTTSPRCFGVSCATFCSSRQIITGLQKSWETICLVTQPNRWSLCDPRNLRALYCFGKASDTSTSCCSASGSAKARAPAISLKRRRCSRIGSARRERLISGEPGEHTFREAGVKFLAENQHRRSIERDVRALKALDPFIGSLPLKSIHLATIEPYIQH